VETITRVPSISLGPGVSPSMVTTSGQSLEARRMPSSAVPASATTSNERWAASRSLRAWRTRPSSSKMNMRLGFI
jgi:hypothetical protein